MNSTSPLPRRRFLVTTGLGAGAILLLKDPRSARAYAANERLNVALVGVGGRGTWFVDTIPKMQNVVALCDVNERKLTEAFGRWEEGAQRLASSPQPWERDTAAAFRRHLEARPKTFRDFRRMLEEMGQGIDAVVVATPDHTHAVASAAAIRAGKHVFCEKPLTRTLHESRALRELAREHKVATSMGNQGTASGPFRRALELIRDGTLGEIKEVHVWNTGGGAECSRRRPGSEPVPAWLDWDLWLGPAAERPYHRAVDAAASLARVRHQPARQLGLAHGEPRASWRCKVHELWLRQPAKPAPIRDRGANLRPQPPLVSALGKRHVAHPGARRSPAGHIHVAQRPDTGRRGFRALVEPFAAGDKEMARIRRRAHHRHARAGFTRPDTTRRSACCRRTISPPSSETGPRPWMLRAGTSRIGSSPAAAASRPGRISITRLALNEFLMLGNVATQFEEPLEFDPGRHARSPTTPKPTPCCARRIGKDGCCESETGRTTNGHE